MTEANPNSKDKPINSKSIAFNNTTNIIHIFV